MRYLPSTLAVAIMIRVISEVEPLNAMEYRNQLMVLLKINEVCVISFSCTLRAATSWFCKISYWIWWIPEQILGVIFQEQVNECYKLILKVFSSNEDIHNINQKRKRSSSPDGVIDVCFSSDYSNDSWAKASSLSLSLEPMFKRSKVLEQQIQLPSMNCVSIDVLHSPR